MKSRPKIIDRILEGVRAHQTFCVVGHIRPDGDCVGSQLGLALALRNEGKTVTVWNHDRLPDKLAFLDSDHLFQTPEPGREFDCVIATDTANLERLGSVAECVTARKLFINIDHHASNTRYGDLNWVSGREPSTGELIYKLLSAARWPITRPIADCLFTAVSTDTGSFQYPTTRPGTYHIAGKLVARGANLERICNEVYQSHPLSRVKLLKHLYAQFKLTDRDRIAYCWLRKKDFALANAATDEAEGLIDHIRDIAPVVIACIFEEIEPELTRISLRSKHGQLNVGKIAEEFGGGGHAAAAGARIPGTPLATQRRVIAALKHALARTGAGGGNGLKRR